MDIRPCLISASFKNCLSGNIPGKVSKASPDPSSPKLIGSHGFPPTSSNPVAERSVLDEVACCGAKAEAEAARAAARAKESLAMVKRLVIRLLLDEYAEDGCWTH